MDSPLRKTLESFTQTESPSRVRPTPANPKASPTVLRTDFELFHNAATPAAVTGAQDDVSQYQLGVAEGERRASELHDDTLSAIQASLLHLQNGFAESLQNIQKQNADVIDKVFTTVLPALAQHSFTQEFQALLSKLTENALAGKMHILAAHEDLQTVETLIAASGKADMFNLSTHDDAAAKLSVTWDTGGCDINYANAVQNAQQLLTQHFDAEHTSHMTQEEASQT